MKWFIFGGLKEKKIPEPSKKSHHKKPYEKIMSLNESIYLPRRSKDGEEKKFSYCNPWLSAQSRIYDIKITIGEQDRLKILEFIRATPVEVYLKMLIERTKNHFHLYKPLYFKQIGSKNKTNINLEDEDRYLRELMESDLPFEEIQKEIINMRCWIHSHVSEGASCWWSNEDNRNVERHDNQDFFISVVVRANHNTDNLSYNCRLDLFLPNKEIRAVLEKFNIYYPGRLTFTDLPIEVIDDRGPNFKPEIIKEEAAKIVKEKVTIADKASSQEDDYDEYCGGIWQYPRKK